MSSMLDWDREHLETSVQFMYESGDEEELGPLKLPA